MTWALQADGGMLLWIQQNLRVDVLNPVMVFITNDGNFLWPLVLLALLYMRRTREVGWTMLVSLVIEIVLATGLLKHLFARPRPFVLFDQLVPLVASPTTFSFPSGHTAFAFATAFVIYRYFPRKWGVLTILFAALVGFSRLYVGVHYPTDVAAGFLVGLFASRLAFAVMPLLEQRQRGVTVSR